MAVFPSQPGLHKGEIATGLILYIDQAKAMFVVKLLKGARGWLSLYEVTDDELETLQIGSPVSAIVDRVEVDAEGNTHVILERDLPLT